MLTAGPEGDTEGGDLSAKESRVLDVLVSSVQASALPIWILGGAVTASGRILADKHWYDIPIQESHEDTCSVCTGSLYNQCMTCRFATVLWVNTEASCAGCQTQWRGHALASLWCPLLLMCARRCVHEMRVRYARRCAHEITNWNSGLINMVCTNQLLEQLYAVANLQQLM